MVVLRFEHPRLLRSFALRKEIVGSHGAIGGGLDPPGKSKGRLLKPPPKPADIRPIGAHALGERLIRNVVFGHPLGELHGAQCASSAQCMSRTCASDAVDLSPDRAQSAQMAPVPKPRPKRRTFLREWRVFRNLSQETAASRMGIDRTTLSKIERGKVPYDQALLERAADAYACEPADLIMRDPKSPLWTLLDAIRAVPEGQQRQIERVIRAFIDGASEAA